jgi:IS30 family transposase
MEKTVGRRRPQGRRRLHTAHEHARLRKLCPKIGKIASTPALHTFIQQALTLRFLPEQMHYRLKSDFADDRRMKVSIEMIYQSLIFKASVN